MASQPGPQSVSAIVRLFELASRSLHSAGHSGGLYPAQWSALRYLANAEDSQRTSAALARFQQIASGPVTRTVRTLVAKGLVRKAGVAGHHRSERLDLTDAGLEALRNDPLTAVGEALGKLPQRDIRRLAAALGTIISALNPGEGEGLEAAFEADPDDGSET